MPIIDFSQAGRILAGSRKSDRTVGGGVRLRYEPDFGYVLRYEPRNSSGADIVKILPGGVYKVTDAGYAGPTTLKKLKEFSPLRYLRPYLRRNDAIYFGSPAGRYSLGSADWVTLTPNPNGYVVTGASSPDPKETPRWTQTLIEAYADTLVNWVIAEGRLPLGSAAEFTREEAPDIAEYVLSGEPSVAILSGAVSRTGSKKAVGERVARFDDALGNRADARVADVVREEVRSELRSLIINALRSIRKDLEPLITEWITANGMP